MSEQLNEAMQLLMSNGDAVLSTHSIEVEGYPFASLTPYCLDQNFRPMILISGLAQHTKNIKDNPKVSLFVNAEVDQTNKQAFGRLTYLAKAQLVENQSLLQGKYVSYFPEAKEYFKAHDFSLYYLEPKRIRYIGGFGKIFWLETDDLPKGNLFNYDQEKAIVEHMNQDHKYNLVDYAKAYLNINTSEQDIHIAELDQYGFDLVIEKKRYRIIFNEVMTSVDQARSVFVELAKGAKK